MVTFIDNHTDTSPGEPDALSTQEHVQRMTRAMDSIDQALEEISIRLHANCEMAREIRADANAAHRDATGQHAVMTSRILQRRAETLLTLITQTMQPLKVEKFL